MSASISTSKVTCILSLEFSSHQDAEKVHSSVELDNQDYITSRLDDAAIRAEVHSPSLNSLLHTLDDFLACISVAEKVVSRKVPTRESP